MSKDYYFMQRNTGNTESVTVEYGFLDGKGDDVNLLKNSWQNLAEGVVRAVTQYAGIPYNVKDAVNNNNTYVVVSGDSLWSIAKRFNSTVDELKRINNLTSNLLSIGQVLKIVDDESNDNIIYEVKRGDTLYSIARNFNSTVSDIMKLNNLTSNLLNVGDFLFISPNNLENNIIKYIVKSGDTLYKISKEFNTTVTDLINKNGLDSTILSIGQELNI